MTRQQKHMQLTKYEQLLRRLRSDPRIWHESLTSEQINTLIKQVKEKVLAIREELNRESPVGPYSGLTRKELMASGTLETDWF